jgi:hypothetical protein
MGGRASSRPMRQPPRPRRRRPRRHRPRSPWTRRPRRSTSWPSCTPAAPSLTTSSPPPRPRRSASAGRRASGSWAAAAVRPTAPASDRAAVLDADRPAGDRQPLAALARALRGRDALALGRHRQRGHRRDGVCRTSWRSTDPRVRRPRLHDHDLPIMIGGRLTLPGAWPSALPIWPPPPPKPLGARSPAGTPPTVWRDARACSAI